MKSIKVFYHGKRLKDIYPYATRWQMFKYRVRRIFRFLVITSISFGILYGLVYGAFIFGMHKSQADTIVVAPKGAPILDRIMKCESKGSHYQNGQVKVNVNKNGSVDIGIYQINLRAWGAKASAMGLDLTKEKDNEAMAKWIYENVGTGPWYSSENCWSK